MASSNDARITANDLAQVEAWAASSFSDPSGEREIRVRGRGSHIQVEEHRARPSGGSVSRSLVRFRRIPTRGTWIVHRASHGGRWIAAEPVEGSLGDVLDAVDLRDLPPA